MRHQLSSNTLQAMLTSHIYMITLDRRQSKMFILSMHIYKKKRLKQCFRQFVKLGKKWQSKTLVLAIFDLCSLIVKSVFNCRLSIQCNDATRSFKSPRIKWQRYAVETLTGHIPIHPVCRGLYVFLDGYRFSETFPLMALFALKRQTHIG